MTDDQIPKVFVRSGIWTHAHICGPEHFTLMQCKGDLESGALDHSAILTWLMAVKAGAVVAYSRGGWVNTHWTEQIDFFDKKIVVLLLQINSV